MKIPNLNKSFKLKLKTDKKIRYYISLFVICELLSKTLILLISAGIILERIIILGVCIPIILLYFKYEDFLLKNWFK